MNNQLQEEINNLLKLIYKGETESLEFKESLRLKEEIGQAVSAFSNANGGSILIGISDDCQINRRAHRERRECRRQGFIQIINLYISSANSAFSAVNLRCDKVKVKESAEKPVFFKNHVYKRVGKTNQRIFSSEIRKLAKESVGRVYWDELVCKDAKLEDIDEEKVRRFLRRARFERRLEIDPDISVREALERLNLIKNSKLTNAVILLFGKEPQKFFLQIKLRCALYKGTTPITFIDLKIIEGDIIDQVEEAENFVLSHIKKAAKIVGFERQEVWEYPINALREAIVNAICHRDYAYSSDITIGLFDDRVEISNPGTLPEPLTPEDLKKQHKSIPRNPLVANAFFLIGNIEQWGEGTNKNRLCCESWS